MKKIVLSILAFFAVAATTFADSYLPTSTWPYVYSEFMSGRLQQPGGATKEALFNICLSNCALHFIEGDMIREARSTDVFAVQIGNDYYVNASGKVLKVLSESENGIVVELVSIDYARLNGTQGAYGSSGSTIATQNLSSLEGIGASPSNMNMNHMELRNSKDDGQILPLNRKVAIFAKGKLVEANAKEVMEAFGVDKNAFKLFQKENKIKWRDPVSVQKVIDFIAK